jgi:hypothetical protein
MNTKTLAELLNSVKNVHVQTMDEKQIKIAGESAMVKAILKAGYDVSHKPGVGYTIKEKVKTSN